jgi:glycosyltransferase involved in cell wall biosynthesis
MSKVIHLVRRSDLGSQGRVELHLAGLLPALEQRGWDSELIAADDDAAGSSDALSKVLRASQADAIHVHTTGRLALAARTAARILEIPYAVTVFEAEKTGRSGELRVDRVADQRAAVIGDADLVYADIEVDVDALRPLRKGQHFSRIRRGISPSTVMLSDRERVREAIPRLGDRPFVALVSELTPSKGQDFAIEAFIRGTPKDMHLVITGTPTDLRWLGELSARANDLGTDCVHLVPRLPRSMHRALLAECALALIPSRSDSDGSSLLEAWAEGAPTFASDIGGLRDVMQETHATEWALPVCDMRAWRSAIWRSMHAPGVCSAEQQIAPLRAERYSWEKLAARIASDYAWCARPEVPFDAVAS